MSDHIYIGNPNYLTDKHFIFIKLNIVSLNQQVIPRIELFMFKYHKGDLPDVTKEQIQHINEFHQHNARRICLILTLKCHH